jgi:hypothetical protein
MIRRMLAGRLLLTLFSGCLFFSGCVGVGPHYVYTFQNGEQVSQDVLDYSPSGKYMAVHAKGRPGWYVLKFEAPEGEFAEDFSTEKGNLEAWYFPPLLANAQKAPDEVYAPDLDYFVQDPESPVFAARVTRLEGKIHAKGESATVKSLQLELKSTDNPDANLKGTVKRDLHFVKFEMPPMPKE